MITLGRALCILTIIGLSFSLVPQAWSAETASPDTIAITYVKFPLNVPIIVAKHQGFFEQEFGKDNIAVEWPEITAGPKQIQAMAAGSVQFASVISADAVITAKANGMDVKVIGVFARAPKAFNIMSKNPSIRTVQDLQGKSVAGPMGSLLNQLLFAALENAGMTSKDVNFVNMPGAQALQAMLSGNIDAALVAGPGAVKAQAEGAKVIANGAGLVRGIILIAVEGQFLRQHPELVERYLAAHRQALRFIKDNPEEAFKITAAETGLNEEDVRRIFPDYDYDPQIMDTDVADMSATQDFLKKYGMMMREIKIEELINN